MRFKRSVNILNACIFYVVIFTKFCPKKHLGKVSKNVVASQPISRTILFFFMKFGSFYPCIGMSVGMTIHLCLYD